MKRSLFIYIRRTIYFVLGFISEVSRLPRPSVVLAYHSIDNTSWRFSNTAKDFKQHVQYLKAHYDIISLDDLEARLQSGATKRPFALLTFDDGYRSLMQILPYLKAQEISPAVFVLGDIVKANRCELGTQKQMLSRPEIKTLLQEGWSIGSHTMTHPEMSTVLAQNLKTEIQKSKQKIESTLGTTSSSIAYPKGFYSSNILREVRSAGYKFGFTMDSGFITSKSDYLKLPRVGVDNTHSPKEFEFMLSYLPMIFRQILMKTFLGKLI